MHARHEVSASARVRVERGIYQQSNGRYAVCFMAHGKPRFRTVGGNIDAARRQRALLIAAAQAGIVPASPRLRFATIANWWLARFESKVAACERRERTLEAHQCYLSRHLMPAFGHRRVRNVTVEDVARLVTSLRSQGCSDKTTAGALATLHSIIRFALRNGWIVEDPIAKLEADERPRPTRRHQRVLGRQEIRRLLDACPPHHRTVIATALYTGTRISELLGLVWGDVKFEAGKITVQAQLSRAHRGRPARRVPPKTESSIRDIPLAPQLADVLREHRAGSAFTADDDFVFCTHHGTPLGYRNVERRALNRAAMIAGLDNGPWPRLRFHDLRHTFASHLILDLRLDVAQVSRILGHSRITTTLDIYTHLFDEARHAAEIRVRMAQSDFAHLLTPAGSVGTGRRLVAVVGQRT